MHRFFIYLELCIRYLWLTVVSLRCCPDFTVGSQTLSVSIMYALLAEKIMNILAMMLSQTSRYN